MNDFRLRDKSWYYETLEDPDEGNDPKCYMLPSQEQGLSVSIRSHYGV